MTRGKSAQALSASDDLVAAVHAEAVLSADLWFPDLDARRVRARVLSTDARARCFLHRMELDDGHVLRTVVVKVRHSQAHLRRRDRFDERPVLNPERTMSDEQTARREYDGLQTIAEALGREDERFGVLRPLAWLPNQSAIVMDLVQEPTLRDRLLETSRTRLHRDPAMNETTWNNAGAWLRIFHDHETRLTLPARIETRGQVAEMYGAYADFLLERTGALSCLLDLKELAVELAARSLPAELPLCPGHGDYVANNMFAGAAGRITVFDPLIRWRVPRYQDLGTLTVGIRIVPLQAMTQGLTLPERELGRYEDAVLRGYFGSEEVPLRAVRAYQLLVLLDRWSDLVSKQIPHGKVRPRLHELRVLLATRHCQREARRLFSLLG